MSDLTIDELAVHAEMTNLRHEGLSLRRIHDLLPDDGRRHHHEGARGDEALASTPARRFG